MKFGGSFEKQSGGFEPLPKGRYACYLENAVIDETKTKKTPHLNLTCVVADGEFEKRKLWVKLWMTEGAYNMTAQQLENLMVFASLPETENATEFMNAAADLVFKLVGKKIEVSVTGHDEYNDKKYEKTFVTGFLDVPNEAFQKIPEYGEDLSASHKASPSQGVDPSEPLPF